MFFNKEELDVEFHMHFLSYTTDKKSKKNNNGKEKVKLYWLVDVLPSHGHLMKSVVVEHAEDSSRDWHLLTYRARNLDKHNARHFHLLYDFIQVSLEGTLWPRWDALSRSILTSFRQGLKNLQFSITPHCGFAGVSELRVWHHLSLLREGLPRAVTDRSYKNGMSECSPQITLLAPVSMHLQAIGRHSHKKYFELMLQNIQRKCTLHYKYSFSQI